MIKVAPSVLAADFLKLGEQIREAQAAGADRLHMDVMDGRFVPNISFGMPLVQAVRRGSTLPVETHLMIVEPERYVEAFAQAGADTIIVHQEVSPHLDRTIQVIKHHGKRAGVAINPSTPIEVLGEVLEQLDLALLMTVNPGFGGQHFLEYTLRKIRQMRALLDRRNPACELEVDGGIEPHTAPRVAEAGARVLVAGSALFGAADGFTAAYGRLQASLGS
ncbi:MAG: ribulose-phosphate 3-epimerase [Planctomycetes bacterium]|nr:ribulose-phosphate 3-epimerase [Planctomycetota bacterium]